MPAQRTEPILTTVLATPIGPLSLLAQDGALVGGGFCDGPGALTARLHVSLRAAPARAVQAEDLPWLVKPLCDYFAGDLRALDGLPVYQPASPGRQHLWAQMREIPPGTTLTYSQLAAQAGQPTAPRAAGAACAANLIAPVVPCHRVLRTGGALGGYYYGLDRKRWLLHHEGALA